MLATLHTFGVLTVVFLFAATLIWIGPSQGADRHRRDPLAVDEIEDAARGVLDFACPPPCASVRSFSG